MTQTILLTGANRGLGLGLAGAFAADGWSVITAVRTASPELEALQEHGLRIEQLDLCDDDQLASLAERLEGRRIDVLVNNAGRMAVQGHQGFGHFDRALWHDLFDINLFTPMRLAELLLPNLEQSDRPRIVNLSSMLGSMELNTHGGLYAYRASKAGVNAISKSMALDLQEQGVIAIALHPGWVRTDMGGQKADLDIDTSVRGMKRVIENLGPDDSGRFFAWDGREMPW